MSPISAWSASFITEEDLASYLQRDLPPGGASLVIDLANGVVADIVGDLDPVPMRVKAITLEVAARGYRNPDALSSTTREIDDYSKTDRREGAALATPGVYLTEAEAAELLSIASPNIARRRVGSIRLQVPHA